MEIKTISVSPDTQVSVCPKRGGIITSLLLKGVEILYLDKETLNDQERNVRGGVPILFPNAGAFENKGLPGLSQHGFARDCDTWIFEKTLRGFKETLLSDARNIESYPYNFRLTIEGIFEDDCSFTLQQKVENLESEKTMPISMGLHPYFNVANNQKSNIKFNFKNGERIENDQETWLSGGTVSVDNPKMKDLSAVMEIIIPDLGIIFIDASPEYRKIWVWSQPHKDFICIEPVMRDPGGLIDDPVFIMPQETVCASMRLSLEKQE